MLVLTRKLQQQIKIGEQITVTILKLKGNTVRVGIQAPRDVRVIRGELPKENAAQGAGADSASEDPQILIDTRHKVPDAPVVAAPVSADEANETPVPLSATH